MIDDYLARLENHLKDIKAILSKMADTPVAATSASIGVQEYNDSYLSEYNELKRLLYSEGWAEAADPDLISDETSEDDKRIRAEGVVEFMMGKELFQGKKFLDFGCDEGLCVKEAVKKGTSLALGYDIKKNWNEIYHGSILTTDWEQVKLNAPYDIVFLYDVLDHVVGFKEDFTQGNAMNSKQGDILNKIKSVCGLDSVVYVRCHPWCSRHATHLYRTLNKAFLHLVFDDVELLRLGIPTQEQSWKIIHPHKTYKDLFEESGFEIVEENPFHEDAEEFFENTPLIANRIKKLWKDSHDQSLASGEAFPKFQLKIQFVDYKLRPI